MRRGVLFYMPPVSSMPVFLEDSWVFIVASAFDLLSYVVLSEGYKENLAIQRYVVRKGRSILQAFWIMVDILFLLLNPHWMNSCFFKFNCSVELESYINELFVLCYIKIPWSLHFERFVLIHDFVTLCISHWENMGSRSYPKIYIH